MILKVYCQAVEDKGNHGSSGDLVVYHGLAESFSNKLPVLYEYLSEHEKSRADHFKHESDYRCYVAVHALLRIELSKLLNTKPRFIKMGESEFGKPFIQGVDLPFSLSRTGNLFAFVVGHSNQFLGIDIEQIKPKIDFINISRNYFSIKEQQLIISFKDADDQKRTFFEMWTRKEALVKALGIGINTDLRKIEVLEGGNILNFAGVQITNHLFKITTTLKKEALISIASSVNFIPVFKNLSFVLS